MGYPISHIVGLDGQTYDIPTGGIKHLSFTSYGADNNRMVLISVPADVGVGDVVVLDKYNSNGGYYWPSGIHQINVRILLSSEVNDVSVLKLDAGFDYLLICESVSSGVYTFRLISGGLPGIISTYRGTNGPKASSDDIIAHYAGTMGAIPMKEVYIYGGSGITLGLSPNTATANIIEAYAYFYNCGKYAIIMDTRASASANVVDITVPNVLSTWFRLNAPSFIQCGSGSDQYGSFCTKTTAQKSTVDDNTHISLYSSSSRWLIIVGDYAVMKP